jgi:PAS domain S-box-containing protein
MPSVDVMSAVLEHSTDAVIVVALHIRALPLCYLNPAFEALTGYTREEAIGKSCDFLLGDDRLQPEIATIRTAIETQSPIAVTLRNYRSDGSMFWNALRMLPVVETRDQKRYLVAVMRDVTRTRHCGELGHEGGDGTNSDLPSADTLPCVAKAASQSQVANAPFGFDTGIISAGECAGKLQRLSPREHDVLRGLVEGCSNKIIAHKLNISPRTVEIYRASLMAKLGVRTLAETLRIAFTAGLAPSP